LNLSRYLSNKLIKNKQEGSARPVLIIAQISIAISIIAMLISFSIIRGFKTEIKNKVVGFNGHLQVANYGSIVDALSTAPISYPRDDVESIKSIKEVIAVAPVIEKPAILHENDLIEGIVFKGINKDYPLDFFNKNLIKGRLPNLDTTITEVCISENIAQKYKLDIDSAVRLYFFKEGQYTPRGRKLRVVGIYNTGLQDYDNHYILGNIKIPQQLDGWGDSLVGAYEIFLSNIEYIDFVKPMILQYLDYDVQLIDIREKESRFFSWLEMLNSNVIVIYILMAIVAFINIIGILLILILEKIKFIGLMKTLGMTNKKISSVFLWLTMRYIIYSLLIGNIITIVIIVMQNLWHIIPLNEAMYYMSYVPMQLDIDYFIFANLAIIILGLLGIIIPQLVIKQISPAEAVRAE
jgi:lipoprotein-releasing system permease protein